MKQFQAPFLNQHSFCSFLLFPSNLPMAPSLVNSQSYSKGSSDDVEALRSLLSDTTFNLTKLNLDIRTFMIRLVRNGGLQMVRNAMLEEAQLESLRPIFDSLPISSSCSRSLVFSGSPDTTTTSTAAKKRKIRRKPAEKTKPDPKPDSDQKPNPKPESDKNPVPSSKGDKKPVRISSEPTSGSEPKKLLTPKVEKTSDDEGFVSPPSISSCRHPQPPSFSDEDDFETPLERAAKRRLRMKSTEKVLSYSDDVLCLSDDEE